MSVREVLVNAQGTKLRIVAVVPPDRRAEIARQLAPLKPDLLFLERLAEAEIAIREDDVFQVALLPASLSDTDWWELWGMLALLNPRPAILVYAREETFRLWSGVLESGGYDVIVDPFSDEALQGAVLSAAKSFEERRPNGSQPE
jgi:DNA-binding NtrC family response regulator